MVNRRVFLLSAGALAVAGCTRPDRPSPSGEGGNCRTPESLVSFDAIGGAPVRYEVTGARETFRADPRYVELLEAWAADWVAISGLGPITGISSYGAYVDKCSSWHQAGRAFDFAAVEHDGTAVSCRYDLWGDDAGQLRNYWRLAASVSKHFTYTLTYRFNEQHHNHIHIDNGVSGYGDTSFDVVSGSQVMLVQGIARYVFGQESPQQGTYDDATKAAVRAVQRSLGITRPLSDPDGWRAFLDGAAAQS